MDRDEICYECFLAGDRDAIEELIVIYREQLTLFIYGFVRDIGEAEDIMIDTFAQLVMSRSRFRRKSSFRTYLFAIGRNLALNAVKKKHHGDLPLNEFMATDKDGEYYYLRKERNRDLYRALSRLPVDYHEVLFLLYFEDMTYEEASIVMKKTRKQISNLAYRAKIAMRTLLESEEYCGDEE